MLRIGQNVVLNVIIKKWSIYLIYCNTLLHIFQFIFIIIPPFNNIKQIGKYLTKLCAFSLKCKYVKYKIYFKYCPWPSTYINVSCLTKSKKNSNLKCS